jgi:hypothetical protein
LNNLNGVNAYYKMLLMMKQEKNKTSQWFVNNLRLRKGKRGVAVFLDPRAVISLPEAEATAFVSSLFSKEKKPKRCSGYG